MELSEERLSLRETIRKTKSLIDECNKVNNMHCSECKRHKTCKEYNTYSLTKYKLEKLLEKESTTYGI